MNYVKTLRMNAEDSLTFKIVLGFLTTPLVLLLLAGTVQALLAP